MKIYRANNLRKIFCYRNSEKFILDDFEDAQCLTDFRIKKNIFRLLNECLKLHKNIVYSQISKFQLVEALCIFLNRLLYPSRFYTDMAPLFWCIPTKLCLILTEVLDFFYQHCHNRLQSWNLNFL